MVNSRFAVMMVSFGNISNWNSVFSPCFIVCEVELTNWLYPVNGLVEEIESEIFCFKLEGASKFKLENSTTNIGLEYLETSALH